ncbi:MAG: hypothetical protein ABFD69_01140 [Candidatus Sumerlaeia bacterium]
MKSGYWLCAIFCCAVLASCGGRGKTAVSASADGRLASTSIPLGSTMIKMTGKLEGPFTLDKVVTPSKLLLKPASGDPIKVELVGLCEGNYPRTPNPVDKRSDEEKKADFKKFIQYKMDEMQSLLKSRTLYMIKMGEGDAKNPPPVYLFYTTRDIKDLADPRIDGELVNAWALRRGIALFDLNAPDHPFAELMQECQAVSIAETRRAKAKGQTMTTIWSRPDVELPAQFEPIVASIETRM